MAYGKSYRYRKSYKRRYNRFSRYNLYRKRSAKAQSAQIYKLNKKVNKIRRDLSPDIKRTEALDTYVFTNESLAGVYQEKRLTADVVNNFTSATNTVRYRGGKVFGSIRYADTGEQVTDAGHYHSGSVRFIIYRLKVDRNTFHFGAGDLIDYSSSGPNYDLNTVRPLREGIGQFCEIIHDRTYNMTNDRELVNFKFKLAPVTMKRIANTNNAMAGEYGMLVLTAGLKADFNFSQSITVHFGVVNYFNDDER